MMSSIQFVKFLALALAFFNFASSELIQVESQLMPTIFSSSPSSKLITLSATSNAIRLRANRLRRPEQCKENLPRKSEDLPELVIVGKIKEVYSPIVSTTTITTSSFISTLIDNKRESSSSNNTQIITNADQGQQLRALIQIVRVIKGNQQLEDGTILVNGFNSTSSVPCPSYIKPNDTVILLLNSDSGDRSYSIQNGNLLAMNLNNLDKINAIAADEPYKRRSPIEDILCEAHYCPYGRCKVSDQGTTSCHCPDICQPSPSPVCGSDNVTYSNECELIREGCKRQKPLFVTKEAQC